MWTIEEMAICFEGGSNESSASVGYSNFRETQMCGVNGR